MPVDDLRALIQERTDELEIRYPDLRPALALQRGLLTRQVELLETFRHGGLPHLSLPGRYVAAKLKAGVPALTGEPVPLPMPLLTMSLQDFCTRMRTGGTAGASAAALAALEEHRLSAADVLSACFGRDQLRVRHLAAHASVAPDLIWLAAELTLAPFAYLLVSDLVQHLDEQAGGALAAWDRGFCPMCGSWPALQEIDGEGHLLRCSFCAHGWRLLGYRCLYCGDDGELFVTGAPDPETPGRRLQLCGSCGGYVKAVELDRPAEFPFAAVEDLVSLDLDMVAMDRRYVRPPLPQIRKARA